MFYGLGSWPSHCVAIAANTQNTTNYNAQMGSGQISGVISSIFQIARRTFSFESSAASTERFHFLSSRVQPLVTRY